MNINIKATNIELTDSIRNHAFKCLEGIDKILGVSTEEIVGQIEVGKTTNHHKSGDIFRAEVNISGGGYTLYSFSETSDLYAAIDMVRDEIIAEARKLRGKEKSLFRRGGQQIKNYFKKFL
ncbi:MAG: ribosome-associated translation inhibitor RaiA [Candidatus Paceibacterota bacterium]|jgi:ribosomal subunit interface protein